MDKVAVLMVGTLRETEFLLKIFPYIAGSVPYDIYLMLRHVSNEKSRIGGAELDFSMRSVSNYSEERLFICELPSFDQGVVMREKIVPVGPTSAEREMGMISMFYGVFAGVSLIRASFRDYAFAMKTRTDYLPIFSPVLDSAIDRYVKGDGKIIVDGSLTMPRRYPDRCDIPWQGSISDVFSFSTLSQFYTLWDFQDRFDKVWTGVPETTLFRSFFYKVTGDDVQSERRNNTLLSKYFSWDKNDTKQSFNMIRRGVLSDDVKKKIFDFASKCDADKLLEIIKRTYLYVNSGDDKEGRNNIKRIIDDPDYLSACDLARKRVKAI